MGAALDPLSSGPELHLLQQIQSEINMVVDAMAQEPSSPTPRFYRGDTEVDGIPVATGVRLATQPVVAKQQQQRQQQRQQQQQRQVGIPAPPISGVARPAGSMFMDDTTAAGVISPRSQGHAVTVHRLDSVNKTYVDDDAAAAKWAAEQAREKRQRGRQGC